MPRRAAPDYDPGRERRAEQRARALLRSCVDERGLGDVSRPRLPARAGQAGVGPPAAAGPYAYLIYPHRPIVAYVPRRAAPAERVLRAPSRTASGPSAAHRLPGLRRRAREVDGAHRRRAPPDRRGQHAPARAPDRSRKGPPRPGAPRALGARAGRPWSSVACAPREHAGIFDLKHRSRALTEGPERAAARAYLHGIGYTAEDLAKPIVGVAHSWIETMPCNFNNRVLAAKVKEGIRAAGGTPMELNTIAISDGITMGTAGMRASLVSREVIADSIELVASAHRFDALRRDLRLRQDDPRHGDGSRAPERAVADALRGVDPARPLQGPGGHDPAGVRGGRRACRRARSRCRSCTELEEAASPGAGACGGQFTANTMAMAFEVLGISPAGSSMVPAEDQNKLTVAEAVRRTRDGRAAPGPAPERGHHQARVARERDRGCRDERRLDQRRAASARRRARNRASSCQSTSSTRSPRRTPLLCDLQPGGTLRGNGPLCGRRRPAGAQAPLRSRGPERATR